MGTTYPPLLLAAAKTLQVILLNAWPRLALHKAEVLRGLTLCWCKIAEEEEEGKESLQELEPIKLVLTDNFRLLNAVLDREGKGDGDLQAEVQMLLERDSHLKGLLVT